MQNLETKPVVASLNILNEKFSQKRSEVAVPCFSLARYSSYFGLIPAGTCSACSVGIANIQL